MRGQVNLNFHRNPKCSFRVLTILKILAFPFFHHYVAGYHLVFHLRPIFVVIVLFIGPSSYQNVMFFL